MTGKKHRKWCRRRHTEAAIYVQDTLIEKVFCMATDDRRVRDQLFSAAIKHLESRNGTR